MSAKKGGSGAVDKEYIQEKTARMRSVIWMGAIAAVVIFALRVVLIPMVRSFDTGRFSIRGLVVFLLLAFFVVLATMVRSLRLPRIEVSGRHSIWFAWSLFIAGGSMVVSCLWDLVKWWLTGDIPAPVVADMSGLTWSMLALSLAFGLLGGVVFVWLGLRVAAEGATRAGMAAWNMLVPVLWMWFRLFRYEMSYASVTNLSESFYDFSLFVLELLFLFQLARYVSGVGKANTDVLLFYAISMATLGISGPLVRLSTYLLGDGGVYLSGGLSGLPDFAIGVLALVLACALTGSLRTTPPQDEDEAYQPSDFGLLFSAEDLLSSRAKSASPEAEDNQQ